MTTENKLKIDDFTRVLAECINEAQCAVVDPMAHAEIWKEELLELAKGKEPVSEDLEKAAFGYAEACKYDGGEKLLCVEHFKAGANWQKQKDEKALNENALLYNARLEGVEIGKAEMKRQMMKEVKEAQVILTRITNATLAPSLSSVILEDSFKEGDKVKVIVIKED